MADYRNTISFGRLIDNVSPAMSSEVKVAFEERSDVAFRYYERIHFVQHYSPAYTVIHPAEMGRVQDKIGYPLSGAQQDDLWVSTHDYIPRYYSAPTEVQTWPARVIRQGLEERHIWLGSHEHMMSERAFVKVAIENYVRTLDGNSRLSLDDCWDPDFRPGYILAMVNPPQSERLAEEVVRTVEESQVLPATLSLRGLQMMSAR